MREKLYNTSNKKEEELIKNILKVKPPKFDASKVHSTKFRKKNFQTLAKEMTIVFGDFHYPSEIYHTYEYISFFLESIIIDRVLNLDFKEHREFVFCCFKDYHANKNDDKGSWFRMRHYLQGKYNEINKINRSIKYTPYSREMFIHSFEETISELPKRYTNMGLISIHLLKNGRKSRIFIKKGNDLIFDDSVYVYQNNRIYLSFLSNAYNFYFSIQ